MTLLVSGWVALDEIETPVSRVEESLGGSATCAALAATHFTDVRLLAAVGEDFPTAERIKMEGRGIDLKGLRTIEGGQTSRWGARYSSDMNTRDTLYTHLGVNAAWNPTLPKTWENSSTAFMAAGEPATQIALLEALTSPRATMVDTIQIYINTARQDVIAAMQQADFVSVNETEARQLTGKAGIAKAGQALLETGMHAAIIKLGEYGAVYASRDDYFVAPGYPLKNVVDPTGAGDTFAGAFLGYLDTVEINPAEVRRAMIYGSTIASFAVEGFGPSRLLDLTHDEVEQRFKEFHLLTSFKEVK
ncbi:MAG: sugar kinase [Dehalococcoidia bacterium]|nr:sugar kinase [Dehalococcoidia bacterium]|tara:strand:- start:5354 stop:6265 length:912 start_codon:yes stop_codon:yes gene_type:complete